MKTLTIVVVTYKEQLDVLKHCFDSVYTSTGVDFELVIVDNASRPETRDLVATYEGAVYVSNPENAGFAAAVNQGMRGREDRYVLLLNPDTAFAPDVLARMIANLDQDPEVGIASCVIRYPDKTLQESIRRFPTFWDQLLIMLKVPHFLKTKAIDRYMMTDADPMKTQDVDSIMGAFMFIRRDLLQKIGLFDERYFIWFEEVDYCKMAHDAGFTIRHYGDVEMTHLKGHSFSKIATLRKQTWMRTSLRKYMKKHYGVMSWLVLWALTPLFIVLARVAAIVKPQ